MKPMLAAATDGSNLTYPLLASPKLDGVRAVVLDGVVLSRSLKPIPNKYIQQRFGQSQFNGLDGELIVGNATASDVFQRTQSGVMSIEGEPEVTFHVFDKVLDGERFVERLAQAATISNKHSGLKAVSHTIILDECHLTDYESLYLIEGYEGVMLRHPDGLYKHGRSTLKQGWLLKLKRFEDSEAEILGFVPLMRNTNEATINELGYQVRSSKKAGKVALDELGALEVRDLKTGVEFEIGTGFTQAQRKELWYGQDELLGKVVKYKYQPVGVKEKPRIPVFLGFRDRRDL